MSTPSLDALPKVEWQETEVSSPHLPDPVAVLVAREIPYIENANRLQNLSIYLPRTAENSTLIGTSAQSLPGLQNASAQPRIHIHVHGGAWRDPQLTSASVEPTVAHAFSDETAPIDAVIGINYTVTRYPTHPTLPYDPIRVNHTDPAREAVHPQHVSDVLHGFALLREMGVTDETYILTGHSCGACIAFQSVLQPPVHWGLDHLSDPPCPAAMAGLNGLYDLPALVHALGDSHAHLSDDYNTMLSNAFGTDTRTWPRASPARFDPAEISTRVAQRRVPGLIVVDESAEDQLVPMNERDRLMANLSGVSGLRVVAGHRCTGSHTAPWVEGIMIWQTVQDILALLREA